MDREGVFNGFTHQLGTFRSPASTERSAEQEINMNTYPSLWSLVSRRNTPFSEEVQGYSAGVTERMLAELQSLATDITSRATEIEVGRRLPLDLVEKLRTVGVFRMFVPRDRGGLELDLSSALAVIEALGRIDGSVGWTAMIGSVSPLFATFLPRETYDRIYEDGPDVITAGSSQPAGTAEATVGGFRVNGRWPFASGCQHADWILALCVMTENGKPIEGASGSAGPPQVRGFLLPAGDWVIEDTWHVAGLKGTGSHHVTLKDVVVPAKNFFDPFTGRTCIPGPIAPAVLQILPLAHCAVTVGMAAGALDDILKLANTGRQQLRAVLPMRESETFQGEVGRIAADLRAARACLQVQAASHWQHALNGTLRTEALTTQATQTAIWLAATCVRIADACFVLAGSSALYETSPLQRRLRDLHTAAQHASAHPRHYVTAGKSLLSEAA
jgi:alkylation response protein AidB-like acyl-CoA dehydrogenase